MPIMLQHKITPLNFDIDIGGYTKLHTHTLKTHLIYG